MRKPDTVAGRWPKGFLAVCLGLALGACEPPAPDGGGGGVPHPLELSLSYSEEEISRDSHGEEIRISLSEGRLTYRWYRTGFGADRDTDVEATARLSAEGLARVEEWIGRADLFGIESVADRTEHESGPHRRVFLEISLANRGKRHQFHLDGVRSVQGTATEFDGREELARAEWFLEQLTTLVGVKPGKS